MGKLEELLRPLTITKFGVDETKAIMDKVLEAYSAWLGEVGIKAEVHIDSYYKLAEFWAKAEDAKPYLEIRPFDINRSGWASYEAKQVAPECKGLEIILHDGKNARATFKRVMCKGFTDSVFEMKVLAAIMTLRALVAEEREYNKTENIWTEANKVIASKIPFVKREPDFAKYDYGAKPYIGPNAIDGKLSNGFHIRIQSWRAIHPTFSLTLETFSGLDEAQLMDLVSKLLDHKYGARVK